MCLLPTVTLAKLIGELDSVRIHAKIARRPWARLWYLLRGFDNGRGLLEVAAGEIEALLGCGTSTIWEWLRDGKRAGAFRQYRFKRGTWRFVLGGLASVCQRGGLNDWGATIALPILEAVEQMRVLATTATTELLQRQSRAAARAALTGAEKKLYPLPTAEQILELAGKSSEKPDRGQIPFLLWVGSRRIWVSKGFVPFGAGQESIAQSLSISARSVRRHQVAADLLKRQVCQSKSEYREIVRALAWEADNFQASAEVWYSAPDLASGRIMLAEPSGYTRSAQRPTLPVATSRFFEYGGQSWIARCNLYQTNLELIPMCWARKRLGKLIRSSAVRGKRDEGRDDKNS